jgi:hypothetical protein
MVHGFHFDLLPSTLQPITATTINVLITQFIHYKSKHFPPNSGCIDLKYVDIPIFIICH